MKLKKALKYSEYSLLKSTFIIFQRESIGYFSLLIIRYSFSVSFDNLVVHQDKSLSWCFLLFNIVKGYWMLITLDFFQV